MEAYNDFTDPYDHLESFKALMMFQETSDALMCKTFLATCSDATQAWCTMLLSDSIGSFEEFS